MNLKKTQVRKSSKLVMGFAVMAATAVVGVAGAANATSQPTGTPSSKDACMNQGWKAFGFKNQGQCVKAANKNGSGYGGGNNNNVNVGTKVDLNVRGNNNVVTIIVNNITNIFN